jgi:hypothetical protein
MQSSVVAAGLYHLDPRWQVYFPNNGLGVSTELNLSAGEARVLTILGAVHDRSTGSEELMSTVEDAEASRHFSPARVNFLRPFSRILNGKILQVGAESGALARFLGDSGCGVDCLEGHNGKAVITAFRCKDVPNIMVYAAGQEFLTAARGYDAVVTTGSGLNSLFPSRRVSLEDSLKLLRNTLRTGGFILAAFENRLSLKSAAHALLKGMDEAHVFASSRSKHELEQAFRGAGFQEVMFYNLFPGYDFAQVVATPECARQHLPMLESILAAYTGHARDVARSLWEAILENGLLSVLSNSFVVLASDSPLNLGREGDLLYIYSTLRRRHFAGENIVKSNGERLTVTRSSIFPEAAPPSGSLYRRRNYEEPYVVGIPYLAQLQEILSAGPWQPSDVSTWAEPWLKLLTSQATQESSGNFIGGLQEVSVVPNSFVDCIPSNIVVDDTGALHPFDFEYEAIAPIPLKFVVFRGLFYSFRAMVQIVSPPAPVADTILELIREVFRTSGLPLNEQEMGKYIGLESELQETVVGVSKDGVGFEMRGARVDILQQNQMVLPASAGQLLTVQLFWKSSKADYSARDCVSVNLMTSAEKQIIHVPIPVMSARPERLRLDPTDRPGLFYIYSLRLLDAQGTRIWSWDEGSRSFSSVTNLQLLDQSEADGLAAYSESDDPQLELPLTPAILSKIEHGGSLEFEMAWASNSDYTMLIRSLRAENRELIAAARATDVAALEADRERLEAQLTEAKATESLSQKHIAMLEAETTNLRNENLHSQAERKRLQTQLAELTGDLNATRTKLTDLTHERGRLEGANWAMQFELRGWRQQVERLAHRAVETRQERETMQELNRQLQAQLRETKQLLDELDAKHRLDDLEKSVKGIYQSRIWRTLVALSSPVEKLFRPRRK